MLFCIVCYIIKTDEQCNMVKLQYRKHSTVDSNAACCIHCTTVCRKLRYFVITDNELFYCVLKCFFFNFPHVFKTFLSGFKFFFAVFLHLCIKPKLTRHIATPREDDQATVTLTRPSTSSPARTDRCFEYASLESTPGFSSSTSYQSL